MCNNFGTELHSLFFLRITTLVVFMWLSSERKNVRINIWIHFECEKTTTTKNVNRLCAIGHIYYTCIQWSRSFFSDLLYIKLTVRFDVSPPLPQKTKQQMSEYRIVLWRVMKPYWATDYSQIFVMILVLIPRICTCTLYMYHTVEHHFVFVTSASIMSSWK